MNAGTCETAPGKEHVQALGPAEVGGEGLHPPGPLLIRAQAQPCAPAHSLARQICFPTCKPHRRRCAHPLGPSPWYLGVGRGSVSGVAGSVTPFLSHGALCSWLLQFGVRRKNHLTGETEAQLTERAWWKSAVREWQDGVCSPPGLWTCVALCPLLGPCVSKQLSPACPLVPPTRREALGPRTAIPGCCQLRHHHFGKRLAQGPQDPKWVVASSSLHSSCFSVPCSAWGRGWEEAAYVQAVNSWSHVVGRNRLRGLCQGHKLSHVACGASCSWIH